VPFGAHHRSLDSSRFASVTESICRFSKMNFFAQYLAQFGTFGYFDDLDAPVRMAKCSSVQTHLDLSPSLFHVVRVTPEAAINLSLTISRRLIAFSKRGAAVH
jgi:hypothetical protein